MTDLADWLMLGTTIAAAGAAAWQSVETRKSAAASRAAVEVANDALELARAEEGHNRRLISETVKTRIDASIPDITIAKVAQPTVLESYSNITAFLGMAMLS